MDVRVETAGQNLLLLHLNTQAARDWVNENVSEERQTWGQALVVEPRYANDLIDGMQAAGLEVA